MSYLVKQLDLEIQRLKDENEELKGYADHKPECATIKSYSEHTYIADCDCGLTKLLEK